MVAGFLDLTKRKNKFNAEQSLQGVRKERIKQL
jgi:hypothetical protein